MSHKNSDDLETLYSGRFLDLPDHLADPKTARFVVIPVPYDGTSTWRKGADRGPEALLQASAAVEWYDIETKLEAAQVGIMSENALAVDGLDPQSMCELVQARTSHHLQNNRIPVILGGEHSVSIGAIRAAAKALPDRLGVLQFDAHADTRPDYRGSPYNHACVMARAREVAEIVQVGIRSIDQHELKGLDLQRVFWAHEIMQGQDRKWMDDAVELLPQNVYITVDLDGFDPSLLPATGTPEPGGLDWYTVNELIRRVLASGRRLVAFDVNELLPIDGQHASDFLAAKLVHRIMCMQVSASGG
ncbi:MAG: agmatinase [Planctomycetes bacterium]|nr:agmatinase [Planctomycetota bacterium]